MVQAHTVKEVARAAQGCFASRYITMSQAADERVWGRLAMHVDIVDTSPAFLLGLRIIFESAGIRVGGTWDELPDKFSDDANALAIGIEVLRPLGPSAVQYVTELSKYTSVAVMVNDPCPISPQAYLDNGAAGIISKNDDPEVLIRKMRDVVKGKRIAREGGAAKTPGSDDIPILSARENQVLHDLTDGLTHDQIASKLRISRHTVDTYIRRVRGKLGLGNKAELARVSVLWATMGSMDSPSIGLLTVSDGERKLFTRTRTMLTIKSRMGII